MDSVKQPAINRGIIYFFGVKSGKYSGQLWKLGQTRDLDSLYKRQLEHEKRVRLKSGCNTDQMELLAAYVSVNTTSDETFLINFFKKYAMDSYDEWFTTAPSHVRNWLADLRKQKWVANSYKELAHLYENGQCPDFEDIRPDGIIKFQSDWIIEPENPDSWDDIKLPEYRDSEGDYYTSKRIIDVIHAVMGGIDLDPASCRLANSGDGTPKNPGVRATRFYDFKDDGLQQQWFGRIWLNPPFDQWGKWAPKLLQELDRGHVSEACVLIPIRTLSAKAITGLKKRCTCMMVPNGREPFWGHKAATPDQGHCILYFGGQSQNHHQKFVEEFFKIGHFCVDFHMPPPAVVEQCISLEMPTDEENLDT